MIVPAPVQVASSVPVRTSRPSRCPASMKSWLLRTFRAAQTPIAIIATT